jgi:hypothetical protein
MNPLASNQNLRGAFALRFALALFVLPLAARAAVVAPPPYPDATHVYNGCHLSTLAYLAKFNAEFPAEQGQPIVVQLLNADGCTRSHTMSLITWQGDWWIRDEYYGVFSLNCTVKAVSDLSQLQSLAERIYARHAAEMSRRSDAPHVPVVPSRLSVEQRIHDVRLAADKVPMAHSIYWVKDGRREIPLVFFRPAPGQIAVYDPAFGTGVAQCSQPDDAKVVAAVATRMGYRADQVRAELDLPTGTQVATASNLNVASK